jgi:lipopolysaccharide heptosyltransferase II
MILLNAVGISSDHIEYNLPISNHHRRTIDETMRQYGIDEFKPFIAINPLAKWETKLWPEDRFTQLADRIITRYGMKIIFTGSSEDRLLIDSIVSNMNQRAVNLSGKTSLIELAALYEKAALVISTDTGPMHLAAAMGTPVVALFGPTAPWRTGPYGSGNKVVRIDMVCSPCFKRQCDRPDCMQEISVDHVMEAVSSFINNRDISSVSPFID